MTRRFSNQQTILALAAGTTTPTGVAMQVDTWENILITISGGSSPTWNVKFQGSQSDTCPDFSAGASTTNEWAYIQVKEYINNSAIDGGTGAGFSGSDGVRLFEFNTNGLKWVTATCNSRSGGTLNVKFKGYSNN